MVPERLNKIVVDLAENGKLFSFWVGTSEERFKILLENKNLNHPEIAELSTLSNAEINNLLNC